MDRKGKRSAGFFSSSTSRLLRGSGSSRNDTHNVADEMGIIQRETSVDLMLSLSPPNHNLNRPPPPPPPPPPQLAPQMVIAPVRAARRPQHPRNPNIPAPYPWATNQRATVHSLEYLLSRGIYTIKGEVCCRRCRNNFTLEYDLLSKFNEIKEYIIRERDDMCDRGPDRWTYPQLPNCPSCHHRNALKPTFGKKRAINWLFLMLGQMLGSCSIAHLKYFCKHTNNHRTGAKDRLVFLAYLGVCRQLQDIPIFQYHPK